MLSQQAVAEEEEEDMEDFIGEDAGVGRGQGTISYGGVAGYGGATGYTQAGGYGQAAYGVQDDYDLAQRAALGLRVRPRKVRWRDGIWHGIPPASDTTPT
jgi:hypothetical protein